MQVWRRLLKEDNFTRRDDTELDRPPLQATKPNMHNSIPIKHTNVIPTNIDHILSSTTHSGSSATLYIFEDNEAVITMTIKGRSPTMRHVSRTHRVALDWLFDRINLDTQNQIRYIDTKHQLADMLTEGNFTRDEWNNLHSFNISHLSSTCCTKNFSLITCSTMAKSIQDQEEEERVVSKSRPAAMNLSSFIATSSSTASSPIASKSPGMPIGSGKPDSRMSSNSFDAASTSQVRLKDAYLGGFMEKQRGKSSHQEEEEDSGDSDNPEAETWYYKGELVAKNSEAWVQPFAHGASSSVDKESQKDTEATWNHYFQISPNTSHFFGSRLLHGKENLCSQNFSSTICPETMAKMMHEERRRDNCGKVKTDVESGLACCDKFFDCRKVWGHSGHRVNKIGRVQGNL